MREQERLSKIRAIIFAVACVIIAVTYLIMRMAH